MIAQFKVLQKVFYKVKEYQWFLFASSPVFILTEIQLKSMTSSKNLFATVHFRLLSTMAYYIDASQCFIINFDVGSDSLK